MISSKELRIDLGKGSRWPDSLEARPSTADAAAALWRVMQALDAGQPIDPADASWLAVGIRRYRDGALIGETLERALGLAPPPGGRTWWWREAFARRDAAVRAVDREFFSDLGISASAAEIALALGGARVPRTDTEAAREAAARRPAARRRFSELAGIEPPSLGARQIERILSAPVRHQLPEAMSESACHIGEHERRI